MRLKISLAVLLTAAGLIAAGCGDDEETTSTDASGASGATGATGEAGAGLLPADFASEADAICAEGDKEIDAESQEVFGDSNQEPSKADQEKFVTTTFVPGIQQQIDDLGGLGDPDEGSEEFATFLDDAQSVLDDVEEDPSLLLSGKDDPFVDVEKQARALGLKDCAA